jgi:hypothetical protein
VLVPGEAVGEVDAAGFDVGDLGVGDDAGTVNGGRAGQGDDEPGIVDELTVPAEQSAAQALGGRRRGEAANRGRRDAPGRGRRSFGVCASLRRTSPAWKPVLVTAASMRPIPG